jgi:4-hydroxy-tetrahydrodipicolinate reductase
MGKILLFRASLFAAEKPAYSGAMRIGVAGLAGRMGQKVAEAILAAGAQLAGGTCLPADSPPAGVPILSIDALVAASDAVIDFTHASTVPAHAAAFSQNHRIWVLGTTGLSAADQTKIIAAAQTSTIIQAANFSPGVNLVLALAHQLAAALPAEAYDAEIVDMHHRQKVDAPSGTALALGHAVAGGRHVRLEDVSVSGRDGHTGPRRPGDIGFAALRGGQIVGEHTVLFTSGSEQIALTHRAFDRASFAEGAVRAALWGGGKRPGLYSMADVLSD